MPWTSSFNLAFAYGCSLEDKVTFYVIKSSKLKRRRN